MKQTFLVSLLVLAALAKSHSQQIPEDKFKHFYAGVIVTGTASPFMSDEAALGVGIAVAIGEELRDHRNGGPFDLKDAGYTIAGSVAVYYVRKAIKKRKKRKK